MVTCDHCRYFRPDPINPEAAMGRCMHEARHGMWHPRAPHPCRDHEKAKEEPPKHG